MPRRQTSSAAGVLAATMLAASLVPAVAQDTPGLRGSIGTPSSGISTDTETAAPPARSRALPLRGGLVEDSAGDDLGEDGSSTDLGSEAGDTDPLGGLGDDATSAGTTQGTDVTISRQLRPSTVDPGLRGTVVADEAVPGFGIDEGRAETPGEPDPFGDPVLTPLRNDIVAIDPADDPLGLRARELDPYEPLGTRLGSFLLFAEADVGMILTDNVLGTPNGNSAYAFELAPEVRLESDWERHAFEAEFTADRSWFNRFSVEDDKIYAALLRGRLDVGARTNVQLELGKAQTQDGRNAVDITNIAGFQTNVQEEQISLAAEHNFNRLTVRAEGSISTFDYEDLTGGQQAIAEIVDGQFIPIVDVRDYRENEITMRGSYEFNPGLSLYLEEGRFPRMSISNPSLSAA